MKARHGFVSNSSSSSFVMFASMEAVNAALEQCSELENGIARKFLSGPEDFLGRKVMSYSYCSGNIGDYYYDMVSDAIEEYIEKYPDAIIDRDDMTDFAFDGFEKKIDQVAEKLGEHTLCHSEDM